MVKSAKPSTRRVPEKDVNNAFITMANKMQQCRALILPVAISQTERLQMKAGGTTERIRAIDRQIAEFNNKNLVLARLNTKGILRPTEYAEQKNLINGNVSALRAERRKLLQEQDENSVLAGLRTLNEIFCNCNKVMTEMDEKLFEQIVEKITVKGETSIVFHLIGGLQLTQEIPEQRRCKRK